MKYLLLFPLLILCGNSLQGQVTNDNRYNLFVQVVGTKYNPDNQNGTNYVTFLIDAAVDNNNTSDWLHNTSTGSGYSHSITWNYDTPETRTDTKFYKTILNATNAADFEYDVSFMAFENDCGSRTTFDECCGFLCLGGADLNRSNYRSFWNTKYQNETGQFYYRWINSNQSKQIRLRHAWRYYNGESRLRPLTFGQVPDNQWRYHTNYNRRNPSGASSRLGYYNNWVNSAHPDLSESPDVTYTFSIASTRQVTIKTTSSTTNYDTRLHLARKTGNGNDDWELISSSGDLSSTNNKSFIQEVLEAGTYYVVVEGDGNAQGRFRLALFSQVPSFAAGSITHPEPWVRDGCTLTRPIESVVPASTPFGTLNLQWQRRPGGASTWTDIAGATSIELTGAEAGAISSDMDYRRRATVGTDIKYSNIVSIHAVPESRINGSISGRVQGKNGNGVVPGVTVYAIANPPVHGECPDIAYSGVTNSNGQFVISDMYYGVDTANTIYSLVAKFEDHKFDPDTLVLPGEMKSTFRNFVDQIILDTTTIFINGTITQTDATSIGQTTCSSEGINFYLQRESDPPIFQAEITDENGNFGIPLPSVGDYTIIPDFREHPDSMNHRFDKMDSSFTNVVDDIDNADFENLERHTLSGALHACGDYRFAGAKLLIEDDPGCFRFIIETDANGNFSKELPARPYLVSFLDTAKYLEDGYLAEDLIAYFNQPVEVDLSWDDALLDLNYRQEPVIEYTGLSTNACGDIILEQGQAVSVIFDITESNTEGCVMDTGVLVINDMISDRDQLELPISNGRVEYTLIPGEPNFSGDFTKTMTVEARHIERPELRKVMTVDVIVEGFKQREASFTTVSPQIPLIILRDPPGDMSYAYLNEQETTEIASEFFTRKGGTVSVWQKAKVGAKFEAGFLGFSTESHFWGSIENELSLTATNSATTEAVMSITTGRNFKTSAQQDISGIGSNADLYVGAAMNLVYAKADIIEYNRDSCKAIKSIDLIMGNDGLQTQFVYDESTLKQSIIPSLESLRDLQTEQSEIDYYQNQIDVWNQTIAQNEYLKSIATRPDHYPPNISWDGGGSEQEYFTTSTNSSRLSLEFSVEIERSLAAEVGVEVGGVGRSGGVNTSLRVELGGSASVQNSQARTTGFVLQDDDDLDRYNTIVKECPVYGTPVFEDATSITSCPYIDGSSGLDGPQLSVVGTSIINSIPPDGAGVFTLRVANQSPDEKTRSYLIDIVSSQGASISTDGNNVFPIRIQNLPYGATRDRQIAVRRGIDPSLFAYEGIEFIVYPEACSDQSEDVTDLTSVTAYFSTSCDRISMMEPQDNWISNVASADVRRVHLTDYDINNLDNVIIQYTQQGLNSWNTAVQVAADQLNTDPSAGTFVDWDISNVADGSYEIRLKIVCGAGTTFTKRVGGVIDRVAPVVFGIPEPVDDLYDITANDKIGVTFEESIACAGASAIITDLDTAEEYAANLSCSGPELQVVPVLQLQTGAYRVVVTGISDMAANVRDSYSWVFLVGDYTFDPDCSPVLISNNNEDQNAISASVYRAIEISSNGMIGSGSDVGYKAEESITLEPGFSVAESGGLEASIEDCDE